MWKRIARYYSLQVDGRINPEAAWYYQRPSPLARKIKEHVAFRQGVVIEDVPKPANDGSNTS